MSVPLPGEVGDTSSIGFVGYDWATAAPDMLAASAPAVSTVTTPADFAMMTSSVLLRSFRCTRTTSMSAAASVGGWAWWGCKAQASLPHVVVRLQICDELIGKVHGHAVDAGLHDTLHELFRADAPGAHDEPFSVKAMNQL